MMILLNEPRKFSLLSLLKRGFTPTLNDFNQFLDFLSHARRLNSVIHLFSQMNTNLIPGDSRTHTIFVKALITERRYEETLDFVKTHVEKTCRNRIFDSLIQCLCADAKDPDKAFSVLKDCLKIYRVLPSSYTFTSLIHCFSSQGKMGRAIEVLRLMTDEKFDYPFDNFVSSSVITGFVRVGTELAVGFFDNAVKSGALRPNIVTCTSLITALCRLDRVREVCDLVSRMDADGFEFDTVFYSNLIHGYFNHGMVEAAIRKQGEAINKNMELDVISYTVLINGFTKDGNVEKAVGFLYKMKKDGIEPNLITYTAIMMGFCKKGKLEEAFSLFKMVEESGIEVDEVTYAILIDGVCRKRDFARAFGLLEEMERKGIKPSVITYNTIISGLCRAGKISEADELSKDIVGDVSTYSILLHGYTEEENVVGVVKTKTRIEEAGVHMDVVMCNVLIKALFMMGLFEDALIVYKGMPELDLAPNSITYCTMIDGYVKAGRVDEALEIFDEFRKTSIASVACYNCMILGLCSNGMVGMGVEVLIELIRKGLPRDRTVYTMLIEAIFKEEGVEGISNLVQRIVNCDCEISSVDFSIFNDALCKGGSVEKALELCDFAKRRGIILGIKAYNSVIFGLCRQGCLIEAFRLFDSLENISIAPSEVTYSILIDKLAKDGLLTHAQKLFEKMCLKELKPNTRVYNSLMNGYCKFGHIEQVMELLDELEAKGLKPDEFTVSSVINSYCQRGDIEGALRIFSDFKGKGILPDFLGFMHLVRGLCAKGRMEESRSVLRDMLQTHSVVALLNRVDYGVETESLRSFIVFLCDRGSIQEAVTLLNEVASVFFPVRKKANFYGKSEKTKDPHRSRGNGIDQGAKMVENFPSLDKKAAKMHEFDYYYAFIASLCSKGELPDANRLARLIPNII